VSLQRRLEPEWLDQLPADDPRAIRTRRDLRRINAWMLNASSMARALIKYGARQSPRTLVDLGSGDGQFMLRVARRLAPHWPNVTLVLQDRQDIVSQVTRQGFAALQWHVETSSTDVFDFLEEAQFSCVDVITSNLFLHHFTDEQLARLLAKAAQFARLVVACEPRRAKFVVRASRLLWVIGCNEMSIHEAVVSARAGFNDKELSALWPSQGQWELHEHPGGLFTHCFAARRTAQGALTDPGLQS
jgi:hypothetical protein